MQSIGETNDSNMLTGKTKGDNVLTGEANDGMY